MKMNFKLLTTWQHKINVQDRPEFEKERNIKLQNMVDAGTTDDIMCSNSWTDNNGIFYSERLFSSEDSAQEFADFISDLVQKYNKPSPNNQITPI